VAAKVLSASPQFPEGALFSTIVLKEPLKSEVLSYNQVLNLAGRPLR